MNIEEFGKLNLTRLDGKISADKKQTWESIYASYRSESLLTGKTVGVDSVKLSGNKNTHCLTVIDNTIKILIPFSEVWYDKKLIYGRILSRWQCHFGKRLNNRENSRIKLQLFKVYNPWQVKMLLHIIKD